MEDLIEKIIEKLPKYLRTKKGDIYVLVVIKNDGCDYVCRYAKENTKSISAIKFKIEGRGFYLKDALISLESQYLDLSKNGIIDGKNWLGIEAAKSSSYRIE